MLVNSVNTIFNIIIWTWYIPILIFIIYSIFKFRKIKINQKFLTIVLLIIFSVNVTKFDNALSNFDLKKYNQDNFTIQQIYQNNNNYGLDYFPHKLSILSEDRKLITINQSSINNYKNSKDFEWNLPDQRFLYTLKYFFQEYFNSGTCEEITYVIEINSESYRFCK